jgi:diguanylate cyclase (GGDEF)-like protein
MMVSFAVFLGQKPRSVALGVSAALVAAIGALSYVAGPQLALPLFYVLPIVIAAWFAGLRTGVAISIAGALFWLGVELAQAQSLAPDIALANTAIRLGCFLALSYFIAALSQALEYAHSDYLTGIANGRAFYDATFAEMRRSARYGGAFTVVALDVDDLRKINERFGHAVGDALLRSVAGVLRNSLRQTDLVSRLGAERFAILLPEADGEAARGAIRKLEGVLAGVAGKGDWTSSFSLGGVTFTSPPESAETALGRAEDVLQAARRREASGRVRSQLETAA